MIIEEIENLHKGDIVLLKTNLFKSPRVQVMTAPGTQHMFVVVNTDPIVVCGVSSNMKNIDKYPWSIVLDDWKEEGFHKPSHVRTDNSGEIKDSSIFKKLNSLTDHDRAKVLKAYESAPQNVVLEQINRDLYEMTH